MLVLRISHTLSVFEFFFFCFFWRAVNKLQPVFMFANMYIYVERERKREREYKKRVWYNFIKKEGEEK